MKLLIAADPHVAGKENLDYLKAFYSYATSKGHENILIAGDLLASTPDQLQDSQETTGMAMQIQHLLKKAMPVIYEKEVKKGGIESLNLTLYGMIRQLPILADYLTYLGSMYSLNIDPSEFGRFHMISHFYMRKMKEILHSFQSSYEELKKSMDTEKTVVIPGNHDLNLEATVMKEISLHLKSRIINGFKVAGYGGAAGQNGMPLFSGIPSEFTTPFDEYPVTGMNEHGIVETTHKSEPKEFLEREQPDIALLHTPLYGIMDKPHKLDEVEDIPESAKHFGSPGMLEYAKTGKTRLFLFGHVHDRAGLVRVPSQDERMVVVMNPGSLGNTEVPGGNFAEVELDDATKEFQSAIFYRIVSPEDIQPTVLYRRRNKAVIDEIEITSRMPQEGRILTSDEMVENAVRGLRGNGGILY